MNTTHTIAVVVTLLAIVGLPMLVTAFYPHETSPDEEYEYDYR